MKCGFLPVSQEAVLVGNVSYHDFYGVLVDRAERETIIKNLGNNHVRTHIQFIYSRRRRDDVKSSPVLTQRGHALLFLFFFFSCNLDYVFA